MEGFCTGTRAGWEKYEGNPVLGGRYGVCFDICVLEKDGGYRMYFSWRTRKSIAVTDSRDGFSWSEPEICIAPRPTPQGWEDDLNRPAVVYRDGLYHMWYTGQFHPGNADGTSHIFMRRAKTASIFRENRMIRFCFRKKTGRSPLSCVLT